MPLSNLNYESERWQRELREMEQEPDGNVLAAVAVVLCCWLALLIVLGAWMWR